ncbi:MAG: Omp28-related outer membrane protein [Bacteroidales bacterium]|nr:Omp28-related outer membrane protein [Bacteroidales bacterium]
MVYSVARQQSRKSWLESPCFDFSETEKPMIEFELWQAFESNRDGAVLQYSLNNGDSWKVIGEPDKGVRTGYNSFKITVGPRVTTGTGWSGNLAEGWEIAKQRLDEVGGKANVIFRLLYASDGTAINSNGLAFNNISIGKQTKTSLVEHFTNFSDSASTNANAFLNNLDNTDLAEVIRIHYHTGYPLANGLYDFNASMVNVRQLFYTVTDAPFTILDGTQYFDYDQKAISENRFEEQLLKPASIQLTVNKTISGNLLTINTQVAVQSEVTDSKLSLFVAVIEKDVVVSQNGRQHVFNNVAREILPTPAGASLKDKLQVGKPFLTKTEYVIDNEKLNAENLYAVAFVQNMETLEVLQAESDFKPLATGTNKPQSYSKALLVFPNPAIDQITLDFNKPMLRGTLRILI